MDFAKVVLRYFRLFRTYSGRKIYLLVLLPMIGSLLEGVGLGLFLPILGSESDASGPLGDLVRNVFELFGLTFSVNSALILLCGVFVLKAFCEYFKNATEISLTNGVGRDLRARWLSQVSKLRYQQFLETNVGKLSNIVSVEMPRFQAGMQSFNILVANIFTSIGLVSISFWVNWKFTVLGLALGFGVSRLQRGFGARAKEFSRASSRLNGEFQSTLVQALQSFKFLISTGRFAALKNRLDQNNAESARISTKISILIPLQQSISQPILVASVAGLIYWQNTGLGNPIPLILTSLLLFHRVTTYLLSTQGMWYKFCSSVGSIDTVVDSLEWLESGQDGAVRGHLVRFSDAIEFSSVGFRFGSAPVLSDIKLKIPKNSMIAFVGESGAGKTTVVDLVTGLLEPVEGAIFVDGVRLNDLDRDDWRKRIGYVTQDSALFNDSVANNVSFWDQTGSASAVLGKVERALQMANAAEFVREMPDGVDTLLGDRGATLSGGQRQRLAIARELYREPELLILDEATSALDSESEANIQTAIEELRGKFTVLAIAHRLSTVRRADCICVLAKGRIVESGSFEELSSRPDSRFRQMAMHQKLL